MKKEKAIEIIQDRIEELISEMKEPITKNQTRQIKLNIMINRELLKRLWYKKEQGTHLIQ